MTGLNLATVKSVVAYDAMCLSIAKCEDYAECKDIADKAAALREYARRIKNTDAERKAVNVRLIAERRYGQLLKLMARDTPRTANPSGKRTPRPIVGGGSPYAKALADTKVSTQDASRYQALAGVPQAVFDAAIRDPVNNPSARKLVAKLRDPVPQMPADSLWLWGRMNDFELDGFAEKSNKVLLAAMTPAMRRDVARIAPVMAQFFTNLTEILR